MVSERFVGFKNRNWNYRRKINFYVTVFIHKKSNFLTNNVTDYTLIFLFPVVSFINAATEKSFVQGLLWASASDTQTRSTHQCNICWKTFKHSSSLSMHKSMHKGSTKCSICFKTFSRITYLRGHMNIVHNVNPRLESSAK